MIQEDVYNGRDNTLWLGLRMAHELIPLDTVTNMQLFIGDDLMFDAKTLGGSGPDKPFDWNTVGDQGIAILRLGHLSVPVGTYTCKLVVFTENSPNGILWDYLRLRFKDA
jgi:hypothetical protein